jgi:hypothetical protein
VLQSMMNHGRFYSCSRMVPILWVLSIISNGRCLQIIFIWIQPHVSKSTYSSIPFGSAPPLHRDRTLQVPTCKSLILLSPFRCLCPPAVIKMFSAIKALYGGGWLSILHPTPNLEDHVISFCFCCLWSENINFWDYENFVHTFVDAYTT